MGLDLFDGAGSISVKKLRALGGTWQAHQQGFGSYYYTGEYLGSTWEIRGYSYLTGYDDESCETRWHVVRDGEKHPVVTPHPVLHLKCLKEEGK